MKFGFFDDDNAEYVITTPKTPLPWINYLGTNDFFSLISNTCGGYSFYKDAKLLKKFVTERGKILPRRVTGTCAIHQRDITTAVKRARIVAILPYVAD